MSILLAGVSVAQYEFAGQWSHLPIDAVRKLYVLLGLAAYIPSFALPWFILAWERFVLLDERPKLGFIVPIRAYWGHLWRCWVVFALVNVVSRFAAFESLQLFGALPAFDALLVRQGAAFLAFMLAMLAFGNSRALGLPAIASGRLGVAYSLSSKLTTSEERSLTIGILSVSSLFPMSDMLQAFVRYSVGHSETAQLVVLVVFSITPFIALAFLATFLCRAYATLQETAASRSATAI